jgi:hypothetical protein
MGGIIELAQVYPPAGVGAFTHTRATSLQNGRNIYRETQSCCYTHFPTEKYSTTIVGAGHEIFSGQSGDSLDIPRFSLLSYIELYCTTPAGPRASRGVDHIMDNIAAALVSLSSSKWAN